MDKSKQVNIVIILIAFLASCGPVTPISNNAQQPYVTPSPFGSLTQDVLTPVSLTPSFISDPPANFIANTMSDSNTLSNCRSGPSENHPRLTQIPPGEEIIVNFRNDQNTWFLIERSNFQWPCWISASLLIYHFNSDDLPISTQIIPTLTVVVIPPTNDNNSTKPPIPTTETPCILPSKPSDLTSQGSNGNNFILSWSAVGNASGYKVHRSPGGNVIQTNKTSQSVEVKNNESFTFNVTAFNQCGEGPSSKYITISR